jgi:beta-ketoacyl ACP synthase
VSGVTAEQLGCVIVATSTHPEHTPASAPQVANRLGSTTAAFDVSAGCAGFCHALNLASSLVRSGAETYVLVIGVEQLSRFMDPTDRGTAFIFADGAGAVVVGPAETTGIGPTAWGSDGSKAHVINQTPSCLGGGHADHPVVQMEGTAVFRWAPFAMAEVAHEALAAAGVSVDDLEAFIPHQANLRITQTLCRNIGLPESVAVATDIVDAGNTSAASVPLAMEAMLRSGQSGAGDLALLIAFGAGLSFAGQVVTMPPHA